MNHKLSNQQFVSLVDFKDARIEALIRENDKIKKENAKLKAFVKKSNGSLEWWSLYGACARPMPVYSVPGLIDHF